MSKNIPLTKNQFAIVDDEDFPYLSQWKWHLWSQGGWSYAIRNGDSPHEKKTVSMHRSIMQPDEGMYVDHINGNGLDNRRSNLRICTHLENMMNQKKNKKNKSGYKGVLWSKEMQKYRAYIQPNGTFLHLGYYDDPIEAAKAYDAKALEIYGQFARINFGGR